MEFFNQHMNRSLFSNYNEMLNIKVQLSFKGTISHEVLTEFGTMIKSILNAEHNTRKIFGVFVELAQNIVLYSQDIDNSKQGKIGIGIIVIQERNEYYYLSSGNTISNTEIENLKNKIDVLNSMNKEELKIYYQEQIKKEIPSDGRNVGLGLLEIARKIDSKIDFLFDPIDSEKSYLTINVAISKI